MESREGQITPEEKITLGYDIRKLVALQSEQVNPQQTSDIGLWHPLLMSIAEVLYVPNRDQVVDSDTRDGGKMVINWYATETPDIYLKEVTQPDASGVRRLTASEVIKYGKEINKAFRNEQNGK